MTSSAAASSRWFGCRRFGRRFVRRFTLRRRLNARPGKGGILEFLGREHRDGFAAAYRLVNEVVAFEGVRGPSQLSGRFSGVKAGVRSLDGARNYPC